MTVEKTCKSSWDDKNFGLYILGAGFSRPAGLPLANELWDQVLSRAERMEGRASQFIEDLDYYRKYRRNCDGIELAREEVNFEEFLSFLDVEFHLGLRGSDTWSTDGNEAQVIVKTLIASILFESMPDRLPSLYLKFAEMLRPQDLILTFNYDCLLERALDQIGKPYRLFPERFREIRPNGVAVVDSERDDEVIILKMHGSMDWFDRGHYQQSEKFFHKQGAPGHPSDPIFNPDSGLDPMCIVEGPRHNDDPLRNLYRVADLQRLFARNFLFSATPFIIPPSTSKLLWFDRLKGFWWGLNRAGSFNFKMAIVGFSLPQHDEYARQIVYTLVRNYQRVEWEHEFDGKRKTPLVQIDLRETPESRDDFYRRYVFVDLDRANPYLGGFNEDALALLAS